LAYFKAKKRNGAGYKPHITNLSDGITSYELGNSLERCWGDIRHPEREIIAFLT
jgi:hypothetical protein